MRQQTACACTAFTMLICMALAGCSAFEHSNYKTSDFKSHDFIVYGNYAKIMTGAVRMAKNTRFCRPTDDGKSITYAPVILPPKTSAPTEWEYNEAGWYRNAI